jgi:hypothetical protein
VLLPAEGESLFADHHKHLRTGWHNGCGDYAHIRFPTCSDCATFPTFKWTPNKENLEG